MTDNALKQLGALGQSIWLDYIRRDLITSGQLRDMIETDGLRGMTSNPALFEQAIVKSHEYDSAIQALAAQGRSARDIYETLSQQDVRSAADAFRPLYESTGGADGYVSLEVNPHLARDASGTVEEARRLWAALDRPNVMIKVPATVAGLTAIRQLITEGINVNVTLLFGLARHRQVMEAYLAGIEARAAQGQPVRNVASVASFFLSRIDARIDPDLEAWVARGGRTAELARQALGQAAIASAKLAYRCFKETFSSQRLQALDRLGVRAQRLLWASTGTKNPAYSDVKYVEALIGPDTVNTAPPATLDAFRDHGKPAARLEQDLEEAQRVFACLEELGIRMDDQAQQLEDAGVELFVKPFDTLMASLARK